MTLLCWVHTGDSISASDGTWPFRTLGVTTRGDSGLPHMQAAATYRNAAGTVLFKNMAISATRLTGPNGVDQIVPAYVNPIYAVKMVAGGAGVVQSRKYLVTCAIGSNDACVGEYANPTLFASAVAAQMQVCRANGADLIGLCTILPRNGTGVATAENRATYNGHLTDSSWRLANGIDYVFDVASEATMGNPDNVTNATYYSDLIHPTAAGQQLLADNIAIPKLAQILADIA